MKKYFLLPLLLCSTAFALPLGNPADASFYNNGIFCCDDNCYDPCDDTCDSYFAWFDKLSFRFGFYGDYVFNRHMEFKNRGNAVIDDFEINTNAGLVAVNYCNLFDFFATFGASNIHMGANPRDFGVSSQTRLFLDTSSDFSWSVGGRATVWDCDCFYFGIEGQYFYTKPNVHSLEVAEVALLYPDNIEMKYTEWQVGLGASYMLNVGCSGVSAIPYVGFKYAQSCADFDNETPNADLKLFELKSQKNWGFAAGFTTLYCDALSVTVEGRWGDEKAVHVNGQIRF